MNSIFLNLFWKQSLLDVFFLFLCSYCERSLFNGSSFLFLVWLHDSLFTYRDTPTVPSIFSPHLSPPSTRTHSPPPQRHWLPRRLYLLRSSFFFFFFLYKIPNLLVWNQLSFVQIRCLGPLLGESDLVASINDASTLSLYIASFNRTEFVFKFSN